MVGLTLDRCRHHHVLRLQQAPHHVENGCLAYTRHLTIYKQPLTTSVTIDQKTAQCCKQIRDLSCSMQTLQSLTSSGWPQSRRKKFPQFSRLFQSHKLTSVTNAKNICTLHVQFLAVMLRPGG